MSGAPKPKADGKPLTGRGIVITRPAAQASALAKRIAESGGRPILFPVIEIAPPRDPAAVNAIVDRLHEFDIAIFVSPSAVSRAMDLIGARRALPTSLAVATVGAGSARALRAHGVQEIVPPDERYESEGLL
jgi:uroporphyrinogen-III synthase